MTRRTTTTVLGLALLLVAGNTTAQEAAIHHGFLFFAGEHYTVDEETFGIYDDGHLFEELIKDNPEALSQFHSYEGWHTTAIVATSLSIAAIVFGGAYYMFEKDMSESLGNSAGIASFAAGGGLLALGMVFEFIAWGSISSAAETYNEDLMDDGPGAGLDGMPIPTVAVTNGGGAHLALTWRF